MWVLWLILGIAFVVFYPLFGRAHKIVCAILVILPAIINFIYMLFFNNGDYLSNCLTTAIMFYFESTPIYIRYVMSESDLFESKTEIFLIAGTLFEKEEGPAIFATQVGGAVLAFGIFALMYWAHWSFLIWALPIAAIVAAVLILIFDNID
ncbi:MAG: hypothetical protein J6N93_00090 [Clostridia bacterium]|nr:hypothetical protein [Clostridia bacterium]